MPEEHISELNEKQEEINDYVDQKTEQNFDLIRSHEERLKKTQDFLERNIDSMGKVEVEKKVLSYQSKKVFDLFDKWKGAPELIDLSNPEDKKVYYDLLLLVKLNTPQVENVSLDDMRNVFQSLKQKDWEKKYKMTTRDFKNRNPLSMKIPGKQYKHDGAYVIYPTFHDGWAAAFRMIDNRRTGKSKIYKPHYTLTQVGSKYASNPGWAGEVAMNLEMPLSTKIQDIPTEKLVAAISAVEDGRCYKFGVDEGYIPSLSGVGKRKNFKKKRTGK